MVTERSHILKKTENCKFIQVFETFLLPPGITGLNTLPIYETIKLAKLLYYYYILLDKNPLTKYWTKLCVNESSAISLSLIRRIYSTNKKFIKVLKNKSSPNLEKDYLAKNWKKRKKNKHRWRSSHCKTEFCFQQMYL